MKKNFKIFLAVLLTLLAVNSILAQSPERFRYQAVLRDATGNIIPNTPVTVFIDILQGGASGTSVYNESHTVTTTAQGVINLDIGGGSVNSGVFANINWSTNTYWVKVTLNGTVISTGQLISTPYSLHVKGINRNPVTGSVGIGTTNPQALLHLWGSAPQTNLLLESNSTTFGPEIRLWANVTGGRQWRIVSGASAVNSYGAGSFEIWDNTALAPRFGILPNGNVGIGTTNPQNKLHIGGFVQLEGNPDAQVVFGTTGANGKRGIGSLAGWDATKLYINGWGDFTGGVSIGKWGGTVETSDLYVQGNYNWAPGKNFILAPPYAASGAGDFSFDFQNADGNGLWAVYALTYGYILSARNNGRVGIGTENPTTKLHVVGTVRIADGTEGTNKVLTSDASGNATWVTNTGITPAVIGTISTVPWNWTSAAAAYTGTTITLPSGKWSIQIAMLIPKDNDASASLWVRTTLTDGSGISTPSGDIIGANLASGYKASSSYGMIMGTIIINNTSGSNKTYYYWGQVCEVYSGSFNLKNFATTSWFEDQIIAYPMN